MLAQLRPALVTLLGLTLITGVLYPLAVTGAAQAWMFAPAAGSLVRDGSGRVVGSALIGQGFTGAGYLHGRPSAAGGGYDPTASSGSNLGPLDPKLAERVAKDAAALRAEAGAAIPADAVTTSGSGLDPDVSPEFAWLQVPRIAAARGAAPAAVQGVIDAQTRGRTLAILGEPRVNVLLVNRALDARFPLRR